MKGRNKTSSRRSAASAASANARVAAGLANGNQQPPPAQQPPVHPGVRTLIGVLITSIAIKYFITCYPKERLSNAANNFTPPELFNLSKFDINNLTSYDFKSAYDEFYAETVQPLVDAGMRSFNGTKETEEKSRVGYQLAEQNATAKHPVVIIPGFVTSGLELWQGKPCLKKHFRQRIWGSASMAAAFFADRQCWREHLALHLKTGMDPENIRVRPAQGFEAADNFIATYWVWSRIIENLADVGYDGSLMTMMSYDWRLGYEYMEKRDGYFTRLKHTIEAHYITSGEKVVMMSHSMGGTVAYYFLQWVVADVKVGGGGGGKNWVEKYLHSFINIAGTLLGVPKAIPALLSGELKDTAQLFPQMGELLEQYFGRRWRRNLWISWGSLYGMLPKGSDLAIWSAGADLVDSEENSNDGGDILENVTSAVLHKILALKSAPTIVWNNGTEKICPSSSSAIDDNTTPTEDTVPIEEGFTQSDDFRIPPSRTWSMKETVHFLLRKNAEEGGSSSSIYSDDSKKGWKIRSSSKEKRKHWSDPIASPLPRAPSLSIYCLYGRGLPTERSYYYKVSCDKLQNDKSCPSIINETESTKSLKDSTSGCSNGTDIEDEPLEAPFSIDNSAKDETRNISNGVRFSDGDASVPLVSLGYMCQKWNEPRNAHNPSGIKVYTREKQHSGQILLSDPGRGGPTSGEHVDILGNVGVIEDVLRIVTGFEVEKVRLSMNTN